MTQLLILNHRVKSADGLHYIWQIDPKGPKPLPYYPALSAINQAIDDATVSHGNSNTAMEYRIYLSSISSSIPSLLGATLYVSPMNAEMTWKLWAKVAQRYYS